MKSPDWVSVNAWFSSQSLIWRNSNQFKFIILLWYFMIKQADTNPTYQQLYTSAFFTYASFTKYYFYGLILFWDCPHIFCLILTFELLLNVLTHLLSFGQQSLHFTREIMTNLFQILLVVKCRVIIYPALCWDLNFKPNCEERKRNTFTFFSTRTSLDFWETEQELTTWMKYHWNAAHFLLRKQTTFFACYSFFVVSVHLTFNFCSSFKGHTPTHPHKHDIIYVSFDLVWIYKQGSESFGIKM